MINWNPLRKILEEMPAEEELKDDNVEIFSNPIDVYKDYEVQALQEVRHQLIPEPFSTFR